MMSISDILYREVSDALRDSYDYLGGKYKPTVILLGHEQWYELVADNKAHLYTQSEDYFVNPKFMGIPIERVVAESYLRIAFLFPLYTDKEVKQ